MKTKRIPWPYAEEELLELLYELHTGRWRERLNCIITTMRKHGYTSHSDSAIAARLSDIDKVIFKRPNHASRQTKDICLPMVKKLDEAMKGCEA